MLSPKHILWILLLLNNSVLYGQKKFEGSLMNRTDGHAVGNAVIYVAQINATVTTDAKGKFSFPATSPGDLALHIMALGCDTTVVYHSVPNTLVTIWVTILPNLLKEAKVVGVSAEEVVRKAVSLIPINYADSSYFAYSSYRQYEKVNDKFCNLGEAKPVVMFKISKEQQQLSAKESFAVEHLRRSKFFQNPNHPYSNNPADLLIENPVYHLFESSLYPERLSGYSFSFDTASKSTIDYLINYWCPTFSREIHGCKPLKGDFLGESWEHGKLIIDRQTFAIKQIERYAVRNRSYTYPRYNNLVIPERKYFCELADGALIVKYEMVNSRWYLKQLLHQYTNEFYRAVSNSKDFVITNYFEWNANSNSRFVTEELLNRFYYEMQMADISYDEEYWKANSFPFYLSNAAEVYKDLGDHGELVLQFLNSWKADPEEK